MCDICMQSPCHPCCPNYYPQRVAHYCSFCGDGIYDGEKYIKNQDGEYRHYDCFHGTRELLEWLGYEARIMEDNVCNRFG